MENRALPRCNGLGGAGGEALRDGGDEGRKMSDYERYESENEKPEYERDISDATFRAEERTDGAENSAGEQAEGAASSAGGQNTPDPEKEAEDNRRANILCFISLACELVPSLLAAIFSPMLRPLMEIGNEQASEATGGLISVFSSLSGLAALAGLGIVIYVRIKYKNNIFGKVLMILYSIVLVLGVIAFIAILVFFVVACNSMCEGCRNMPGILYAVFGRLL